MSLRWPSTWARARVLTTCQSWALAWERRPSMELLVSSRMAIWTTSLSAAGALAPCGEVGGSAAKFGRASNAARQIIPAKPFMTCSFQNLSRRLVRENAQLSPLLIKSTDFGDHTEADAAGGSFRLVGMP